MVTSSIQYLLLLPSYINILHVNAFANILEASWVTLDGGLHLQKQDPSSQASQSSLMDWTTLELDEYRHPNELYADAISALGKPKKKSKDVRSKHAQYIHHHHFRSQILLGWVLTNQLLAVMVTNLNPKANNNGAGDGAGAQRAVSGYMGFLMFGITALALLRSLGCLSGC